MSTPVKRLDRPVLIEAINREMQHMSDVDLILLGRALDGRYKTHTGRRPRLELPEPMRECPFKAASVFTEVVYE